jgi:hypothetical protein
MQLLRSLRRGSADCVAFCEAVALKSGTRTGDR